jgi:hypothetical protein
MIYLIVLTAIIFRFIPHMPNFAPITALAIFSAANLGWKKSVALTLAVRIISDMFLGFFAWPLMLAVYASHLVGVLFGLWIKNTTPSASGVHPSLAGGEAPDYAKASSDEPRLSSDITRSSPPKIGGVPREAGGGGMSCWIKIIVSSLGASVIFFLVTNFAFLYSTYPHNISGIILAYTNGLPFFRGTLLGDLGYTTALFGSYEFAQWLSYQKTKFLIPNS